MAGDRRPIAAWLSHGAVLAVVLAAIAIASPSPNRVTDRDVYEATAVQIIVPDCGDLHCFRALVPWVIGRVPGPSIVRWKAYAVVCNAAAALAVFQLAIALGLTRRAAWLASSLTAFGFGALYTLHDPYTADPLMFALGPAITNELVNGRLALASALGIAGVFAKEFAAAPLFLFAAYSALERRWIACGRTLVAANAALIVWLLFTLTLMIGANYSYGGSESANLASGAGLGPWLHRLSLRGIVAAMFNEFGALYVLAPVGLLLASRQLRLLVVASLPIAAVLAYVQQPDRALWNLHFLVVPLAALVLDRVSGAIAWATVAAFAVGNLRVGAQLPLVWLPQLAIAASMVLAVVCAALALRSSGSHAALAASAGLT
jgi:hypothetical protein